MGILKRKIMLTKELSEKQALKKKEKLELEKINQEGDESTQSKSLQKKRRKIPGVIITPEKIRCTKNIVKNYGKAIANFVFSDISKCYLQPFLEEEKLSTQDFIAFIKKAKSAIEGIDSFRNTLVIKEEDSQLTMSCKKVFRHIGEVFIKHFSVNWIYNARIVHKLTYLKYRFKMLRRIQNPDLFTYLKS